jgi:hypothetical protein
MAKLSDRPNDGSGRLDQIKKALAGPYGAAALNEKDVQWLVEQAELLRNVQKCSKAFMPRDGQYVYYVPESVLENGTEAAVRYVKKEGKPDER